MFSVTATSRVHAQHDPLGEFSNQREYQIKRRVAQPCLPAERAVVLHSDTRLQQFAVQTRSGLRSVCEVRTRPKSTPKSMEIRGRIARLTLLLEAADRGRDEHADLARKAFELSQTLTERWVVADCAAKRQILEIVCLNFRLDGVSLVPEWRKPFDVVVKGLSVLSSRGDKI